MSTMVYQEASGSYGDLTGTASTRQVRGLGCYRGNHHISSQTIPHGEEQEESGTQTGSTAR